MIPADEAVAVRRIVCRAPFDKCAQVALVGHRRGAEILLNGAQSARRHLVDLVRGGGNDVVSPVAAAAGVDQDPDLALVDVGADHLA